MPKYEVKVEGSVYDVDAPDEATAWNWANYTHRQEATKTPEPKLLPVPKAAPETGFIPSVKRGFYQTGSLLGDVLPAMVARGFGFDEYAEKQWKEAAETQKSIEERFPQAVPSFTDIKDVGSAYNYIVESVGENLASILPTIFTGGTAGLLTAGARKAAITAAQRVAAEDVARAMAVGPLQEAAIAQIQKKALDVGIQQARSIALKSDVAGALVGSSLQNIPAVYQSIKEKTGKEDIGAALIFGGINAGLDAVMPITLLQKARKMGVPTEEIGAAFYKRFGKGLATGFAQEGATEFAQEVSSAAAEKFVDENQEFFTKENLERFVNAGLKGGIGGGVITGATNVLTGKGPEKAVAPPPAPETEKTAPPPAAAAPPAAPVPPGTTAPPPPPPTMEDILGASLEGTTNVATTDEQSGGAGATVAGKPGAGPATGGAGGADTSGVVSTQPSAGELAGGEGAPTAPVAPTPAEPPAAPANLLTDDFLNQLGIAPQAAIREKVGQIELGSLDLVKSLRGSLLSRYVSDDVKANIRSYLEGLTKPAEVAAPVAPPPPTTPGIASAGAKTEVGGAPAPAPAPAAPSIQSKIDDFDAMFGDDGLPSRGTAELTPAQQAQEARLKAEGERLGVIRKAGETSREYWARVKPAMALEGKISAPERGGEGVPLSAVPTTDIAAVAEEAREGKRYKVTPEQRAMYDETMEEFNKTVGEDEQLPTYEKLRELHPEGLLTYFRDHIKENTQEEHDKAAAALSEYLSDKKSETRAGGSPQTIQAKRSYERERGAFSAKTGLNYSFPGWNTLSDESQRLFTTLFRSDSAIQQDMAFRAVKNQIQKEKLEEQQAETAKQVEISSTHEMLREAERAREKQPAGKGVVLPESVLKKLLAGKISGEGSVLDYLLNNGKGIAYKGANSKFLNLFSREIFRGLARALNSIEGFKVNVVYDENMVLDEIGKYDASTNTLYLGPNGLDEATVLHELVHAGTVKIIHQYFTDKAQLTPRARAAVEHLQTIAGLAKTRLGSRYPNAFENLYEFVAYAFTDLRFQKDLASIRIPRAAKATDVTAKTPTELRVAREIGLETRQVSSLIDNLWDYFTGTLAYMYRLFYPRGKTTKILQVTEESRLTRATTASEKEKQKEEAKRALTKQQQQEIEAQAQRLESIEEKPITAPEEEEELTATQKEVLAPEKLFEDPDAVSDEEKAEASVPEKEIFATQYGVTNLRRALLVEPGYKGNLLLEAASVLQDILAAPEGGITALAGKGAVPGAELMAKAGAPAPKQGGQVKIRSAEEITNDHPLGERTPSTNSFRETFTRAYPFLVRKFQNAAAPIKAVQEFYEKLGKITHIGPNINNVWSQITKSSGRAWMHYVDHMMAPATKLNKAIEDFAKSAGLDVKKALQVLHSYAIMLHEPERRMVKYLKTVPLNDVDEMITLPNNKKVTPDAFRSMILARLAADTTTPAQAVQLRQTLEKIALPQAGQATSKYWAKEVGSSGKRRPTTPEMFDITNLNRYNVAGLNGIEELNNLQKMFAGTQYDKAKLDAAMSALREVHDATELMDKAANYRGKGVDNVIAFYGYKNYVPFKGKPGKMKTLEEENRDLDPFASRRIGADLNEKAFNFNGRQSDSENPFLQSLADGARAALRLGRKDLTLAIKNAVDQRLLHGDAKTKISFADRYLDSDALKEAEGETKVLHYEPDGTITVITLTDKAQREAIRRTYREVNPLVEKMNAMTSFVGQTHTRYNIPFAPMNFVRDALTNAFALGAEFGPVKSGQLIGEVARAVAEGGFHKTVQIVHYLGMGNMARVRAMANTDKTGFTKDLLDYLERGGRVSYLQGLAARSQLDQVVKEAGRSGILKTKDGVDKFFDSWTEMFEFTSRVASYRVLKQSFTAENLERGMPKAEAEENAAERATEYAKNLANFEQVGEWGKNMGALFMFFRPAATGAVRAIESLRPAFGFNEKQFRERAKGKASPAQIDAAVAAEMKKVESARAMVSALLGMGACIYIMSYMMAGDDDQGRNKTSIDDPARWTRYARFFVPGMENPIQIPWGFGLGSFASAGAQVMSGVLGNSSAKEILGNIVALGLDNFFPVPISRMNPLDNFSAWVMDSSMPSLARPFLEYVMNVDSLGREIYNNRQSRAGDAYTGGDSIPEIYKMAARTMFDATLGGVDISPNTLYFWASNYADGFAKFASAATDLGMVAAGTKNFNPKTGTLVFDSFFGAPANFDARQFSSLEGQIKALERRLNTLKQDPPRYAEFVSKNPMAQYVVDYYNKQINGPLKQTRQMMNDIRASRQFDPKERNDMINNIKPVQNLIKRNFIDTIGQISDLEP